MTNNNNNNNNNKFQRHMIIVIYGKTATNRRYKQVKTHGHYKRMNIHATVVTFLSNGTARQ